jgi:D-beta-D-heptose 7-phosphate kinase/D-beta-D-heptose 1-phosphate adenosyltransferase
MILDRNTLSKVLFELKLQEKKIVFTNGCFDIIHSGHIYYLTEAKKLGDFLVVGLNSDDSIRRLKGKNRPVNILSDRAIVLSALKPVDFVCVFDEDTPYNLIDLFLPDVLVKGGDYTEETVVGADIVKNNGGNVVLIPFLTGKSTTHIINQMKK